MPAAMAPPSMAWRRCYSIPQAVPPTTRPIVPPHPYDEPTPEYWRLNNALRPHAPPSIKERGELWP